MNEISKSSYPSSIVTPFIRTLFEIRLFILTVVFVPRVQFFNDVFSVIVVESPTAQFVICVDRTLLCKDINGGTFSENIFSHNSKIWNLRNYFIKKIWENNSLKKNCSVVVGEFSMFLYRINQAYLLIDRTIWKRCIDTNTKTVFLWFNGIASDQIIAKWVSIDGIIK